MLSKIKNAIIFLSIAILLILVYVFFIKKSPEGASLVSSVNNPISTTNSTSSLPALDKDFPPLLLNVKNIKLDDSIFSDKAFQTLTDSSITLIGDGNEGRANPFAPLGADQSITSPLSPSKSN